MNFEDVIRARFSTRKFSDKEISDDNIKLILEAGRLAPTAKNLQPFKIYVIKTKEGLAKIDQASPCRYNAPLVLLVCGDKDKAFVKEGKSTYEMDASIVATHMMLEATNIGLNNIWVEMFNSDLLKTLFNLPSNMLPVCLLPMGYQASDCPESPNHLKRQPIDALVEYL